MSTGKPPRGRLGDINLDIAPSPRVIRSEGRRRLLIASALLVIVMLGLVWAGPATLRSPHEREAILPGLTLEAAANGKGVVVTSVQNNSIADDAGIEVGDRIDALDQQRIKSIADAQSFVGHKHPIVIDIKLARSDKPVEVIYAFPQGSS